MSIFESPDFDHHEYVTLASDDASGLRCLIAIHNTTLGPALGGARFWPYETEQDAINDALRLSKGMTYKAAMAGLPLGGGKSVIIGDPRKIKTPALLRAFGRAIERLNGLYTTAEDVGTAVDDMQHIRAETPHVRGRAETSGDPSPFTAYGTFMGIKAALSFKHGQDDLKDIRIAVQGLGHVGMDLCRLLHNAGAQLIVSDLDSNRLAYAHDHYDATTVTLDAIYDQPADVFAPCALGACLNDMTLPRLKTPIIAGAANNQLATPTHAKALNDLGILYAPDYIVNAGGLINVAAEGPRYDPEQVKNQVSGLYDTLLTVFDRAQREQKSTAEIADLLALERIRHH